jgi:putative tryptophan/tyrosine transport system substrate-binding protein
LGQFCCDAPGSFQVVARFGNRPEGEPVRRREFITLVGGATAWPMMARAQQADRVVRVGYIGFGSASQDAPFRNAFRDGLRDLGYAEGNNFQIEARFNEGDNDKLFDLATELVRLNVDVIVTYATGVLAAQRATRTIPIVMASYTDPVATGLIASLAHPGGNASMQLDRLDEPSRSRLDHAAPSRPAGRPRTVRTICFVSHGADRGRPCIS